MCSVCGVVRLYAVLLPFAALSGCLACCSPESLMVARHVACLSRCSIVCHVLFAPPSCRVIAVLFACYWRLFRVFLPVLLM